MGIKNTDQAYGSVAKFFHWGVALTIYGMLILGYCLDSISPEALQFKAYDLHKAVGLTLLVVIVLRFIWRLLNKTPPLPPMPIWQKWAAHTSHYLLYAVILSMPLSGWLMSTASNHIPSYFGLFSVPMPGIEANKLLAHQAKEVHEYLAIVLICLIVIHVSAALKHHFVNKNQVLRRMLPFCKSSTPDSGVDNDNA